jgi:hypothetical protein
MFQIDDCLRCKSCGHKRYVDVEWLAVLEGKLKASESLSQVVERLKCKCGSRGKVVLYSLNQQKIDYNKIRTEYREGTLIRDTMVSRMEEIQSRGNLIAVTFLDKFQARKDRLSTRPNIRGNMWDPMYGLREAWSRRNEGR